MLRKLIGLAIIGAVVGLAVFWFVTIPATVPASALAPRTPDLANGKELFFAGGCASCHAVQTKEADKFEPTKLAGGLGLHSPFGTFYVPNISPDPNDGVGRWSEADFATAMLKGTSPSGSHYYPAFPFGSYQRMKLDDVRDVFAFIKTLPAVQGKVRDHDLPFPFNIRRTLGGWKFLFLDGKPFVPDASQSAEWNRGAYLVNGPGHCAECHSPRNPLGGIVSSQRMAGGPNPEGQGWVPNITQKGLKEWSAKDIEYLLESGQTPDGDSVGGSMTAVIRNTSNLTPQDRTAMAVYLKSLPAVDGPPRPPKKP
jgi:mono/diheme cytochrome c family protein